ncbi:MAG TPA: FAD-binding protein, partial [Bacillales bacterium]
MDSKVVEKLKAIIPENRLVFDVQLRYNYGSDASSFGKYLPDVVVHPKDEEEISRLLKLANQYRVPVYPRGSATSLSGGPLPVKGGMVLDLSRLNQKLVIDRENLLAIVSPGVITDQIHQRAEEKGLFYPPDPSSSDISTIGGNLLENAGGPKGLKYGTTKEYVIGLEVVAPTGEIFRTGGKTVKNVTGYDLTRLVVGSEGTPGIVTEATLRLIPKPPERKTMLATFDNLFDSGQAVTKILSSGILPASMQLMDQACIRAVEDYRPGTIPKDAKALVIIEVDGHEKAVGDEIRKCRELCNEHKATTVKVAEDEAERDEILQARKMVLPAVANLAPTKLSEDATVPRGQIPAMMQELERIREKYDLHLVVFGHAGDGNLHPNILADGQNEE